MLDQEANLERFNSVNKVSTPVTFDVTIQDAVEKGDIAVLKESNITVTVTHTNYEKHPQFEFAGVENYEGLTYGFNKDDIAELKKNQNKGGKLK